MLLLINWRDLFLQYQRYKVDLDEKWVNFLLLGVLHSSLHDVKFHPAYIHDVSLIMCNPLIHNDVFAREGGVTILWYVFLSAQIKCIDCWCCYKFFWLLWKQKHSWEGFHLVCTFEFSESIIDMDFPSAREAGAKSTSEQRQVNKRGGWSCTVTTVRSVFAL